MSDFDNFDDGSDCEKWKEPDLTLKNEKLRCAAPDLLEALQNLMGLYNTPMERMKRQGDEFYKEAIDIARKAIEKAT